MNERPTHHMYKLLNGTVHVFQLPINPCDSSLTIEQKVIIEQDEEIARLKAIIDDMPMTRDKVHAYDGMELFTSKKQDYIFEPCAETKAYWITRNGEHITDSVGNFFSSQEAADEADKEEQNE